MNTENKKKRPLWARTLGLMAYIGVWTVIIMALKFGAMRAFYGAPAVDIRDLPPAEYQAAIEDMISKAKSEKRREAFELCMNLNMRKGEQEIKDCLSEIGE